MTPELHTRAVELFEEALILLPEARPEFLARACGGNHHLLCEVEAMLAANTQLCGCLEKPPHDIAADLLAKGQAQSVIGERLGDYEVIARLGAGGMGEVFLAEDRRLGRKAALKLLPEEFFGDPVWLRRFEQEACAVSALNHPNIVTIYGVGEGEAIHFLATEFIEGRTLSEEMTNGPVEVETVIEIAIQAASALIAAHKAGIVHRDIKPENIIRRPDGLVKMLDFGLAKRLAQPIGPGGLQGSCGINTTPGLIVGTPRYMSPEQARGLVVDSQTDLFSLGCVLYELLAGCSAMSGDTPGDVLAAVLTRDPVPLQTLRPECPAALVRVINRALEKDRDQRYRTAEELLADLKTVRESPNPFTPHFAQPPRWTMLTIGLAALIAAAIGLGFVFRDRLFGGIDSVPITSLAVLPLENLSGERGQEYFADGMTDELIAELARIGSIRVISHFSVMQYKRSRKLLPEIARELGVDAILLGSVLSSGNRVRINAQLVRARRQSSMWAQSYERDLGDALTLQAEMARTIAGQIRVKLTPREKSELSRFTHVDPKTHELYLKGLYEANKATEQNLLRSVGSFNQAIARSPGYAPAYAGLALAYTQLASVYLPPREAMPKAKAAALKALELDDKLSDAHTWLGFAKLFFDWDWPGAEEELKRAIDLNPNSADAHLLYEWYLLTMDRPNEALEEVKRSHELDPLSLRIQAETQFAYIIARRYDDALSLGRQMIEMEPGFASGHANNGLAYAQKGDFRNAIAEMETAVRLQDNPTNKGYLAHVRALAGDRAGAEELLGQLKTMYRSRYVCPYEIATAYTSLGQKDEAYKWMKKGVEDRADCMIWLRSEPWLDSLRHDIPYRTLSRQIGLPNPSGVH